MFRSIAIATKLHFADFDPCTHRSKILATTCTADVRPNLTTVCLYVSLIGTGLLANTPVCNDKFVRWKGAHYQFS